MRETRQSGSEGGGTELNRSSLPLSLVNHAADLAGARRRTDRVEFLKMIR